MQSLPKREDFGPAYFRGRGGSNYREYGRWQGHKIVWLALLWLFARITRRYGTAPLAHLDVGCAFGYFVAYARPLVHRSVGVDISTHAVARARALFPESEFVEARAEALPFQERTFDILTAFDTVEHLPDVRAGLAEFHRVLRPQGTLLLRMPYDGFWRRRMGWRDKDPTHVSVLPYDSWKRALADTGFVLEWSLRYPTATGGHMVCRSVKL